MTTQCWSRPVIFVIGASGNIGKATISVLSSKYGDKLDISAGIRNPDKADGLKLPGVKVVQATMGDKDNLKNTLKGVDALYIITPAVHNRAELVIKTAEAAKEAGVKFLLVVSTPSFCLLNTIFGSQYTVIESTIAQLEVPYCFLKLPLFIDNTWTYKHSIQTQSIIYDTINPDISFSAISIEDTGKVSAAILSDYTKHYCKTYTIASDRYTNAELASAFTEALGREIKYVQVHNALMNMETDIPQSLSALELEILELKRLVINSLATNIDTSIVKTLTGEEPMSIKTWIDKHIICCDKIS